MAELTELCKELGYGDLEWYREDLEALPGLTALVESCEDVIEEILTEERKRHPRVKVGVVVKFPNGGGRIGRMIGLSWQSNSNYYCLSQSHHAVWASEAALRALRLINGNWQGELERQRSFFISENE